MKGTNNEEEPSAAEWLRLFEALRQKFPSSDYVKDVIHDRCPHERNQVVAYMISGGGTQYRRQCLDCGYLLDGAIAHSKVQGSPPPFDAALRDKNYDGRRRRQAERKLEFAEWNEEARQLKACYLKSKAWQEERKLVFERAGGICEVCRERDATAVLRGPSTHNLGADPFGELQGLCATCLENLQWGKF